MSLHYKLLSLSVLTCCLAMSQSAFAGTASFGWMGGLSEQTGVNGHEQAWQVFYNQEYDNHLGFNLSYLNEGHFSQNYRDGISLQLGWWSPRLLNQNLGFNVATGPYLYFDTDSSNPNQYQNLHGLALNTSIGATLYSFDPVLLNVSFNHIEAINSFNTNAVFIGASWDLDRPLPHAIDFSIPRENRNQISLLYGRAMVDGKPVVFSPAYSINYHYAINSLYDISLSYLNEGDNNLDHRHGVDSMLWLKHSFYNNRLTFSAGAGPYYFHDALNTNSHFAGIFGLATQAQLTNSVFTRFEWDRTLTHYDRDSDIYLLGLGYSF